MSDPIRDALAGLDETGLSLGQPQRNRIVREALAAWSSRAAAGAAMRMGPYMPRIAWGSALLIAFLVLSVPAVPQPAAPGVQDSSSMSVVASGPRMISAKYENGSMILEWEDGGRGIYKVRQAASLKELDRAPGIQVRGTRLVALPPSNEQVLFYRVE